MVFASELWEWVLPLLLPVAAASGWYSAKRGAGRDRRIDRIVALNTSYTRGLEYMLQDRVDEALALLADRVAAEAEAAELRLSVGNFFRRRGEVDKALAIHESLLALEGISDDFRCCVQYELATDYCAAGLLDRAEEAFQLLCDKRDFAEKSLDNLLKIYQRENEWQKAIRCLEQLRRIGHPSHGETIAQFYCELAALQLKGGNQVEASELARSAIRDNPDCVRAHLLLLQTMTERELWQEARAALTEFEARAPQYLPQVLDLALQIYANDCDERGLQVWLRHLHRRHGCVEAAILLADRLAMQQGPAAARSYLVTAVAQTPARPLLQVLLGLSDAQDASLPLPALTALRTVLKPTPTRYRCSQCGFVGADLHWRCPSCQTWETIKPVSGDAVHIIETSFQEASR